MQFTSRLAAALAAVAISAPAMAAVTTYNDAAAFQAALTGGSFTETFTGVGDAPAASYGNATFGFQAAASGGLFSASGNDLSTNFTDDPLTLTFTTGNVHGVGGNFFLSDIDGGFNVFFDVLIALASGEIYQWSPSSADAFVGFVSDQLIASITFLPYDWTGLYGQTGLYATADNVIVGSVPEPASLALAGLAIAGLAARRRRTA